MKRLPLTLILITILVLPLSIPFQTGWTDDCYVQIVSVTLNQSSLEIGEKLQVNIVYDLYYDQTDPLGIGSVSVSINIQGIPTPLSFHEFTNQGLDVQENITFDISPNDWSPNETGQVGIVNVEGWAQDSVGSMTDSVQQQFTVINTYDVLFLCNSTLHIVRPNETLYIMQLTTLDYQPLFNVSVQLIEIATNSSWSQSITNTSGYAILTWSINETFTLGPHEFLLIAQDGSTTLGTIPITMIVYEQTVLEQV